MKKTVLGILVLIVTLASLWVVSRRSSLPDRGNAPPPPENRTPVQAMPATDSNQPTAPETPEASPPPLAPPPTAATVEAPPAEASDDRPASPDIAIPENPEQGQASEPIIPPASADDQPEPPGMGLLTDTGETAENRLDNPQAAMVKVSTNPKGKRQTTTPAPLRQEGTKDSSGDLPYSVLLETFDNPDNAQKAVALYAGKGISAYAVKVDLGSAGIKYRLFSGSFASEGAARGFINARSLRGKLIKHTPFTAVVGVFNDRQELNQSMEKTKAAGAFPYVFGPANGPFQLVVGAFYTRDGADNQCRELVSSGLSCSVERRSAWRNH